MRLPLLMQERYEVARDLHRRLYAAIAERDEKTIQEIACTGVKRQATVRIANKKHTNAPGEQLSIRYKGLTFKKLRWWLQMMIPPQFRSTQILVDRESPLPIGEGNTLRQVIVRLKSSQTLTQGSRGAQETFDKDEYVVIQTMNVNGEQSPWKIWGTVEGSTPKQIDQLFKSASENGFWTRMKDQVTSWQAGGGSTTV